MKKLAIAAGIVLVGSTFLRIRQVAKERTKTGSGGPAGPRRRAPVPAPVRADKSVVSAGNRRTPRR